MRRLLLVLVAAGMALSATGCLINAYSSNPNERIRELINQSEDLRSISYEWERIWFTDHPSHLTPERVDGGIQ
jgi:hypothetical protein